MAPAQRLATARELYEATLRERQRRGRAAVAPELEPFVGAQRWASGMPLPEDLLHHLSRRERSPPNCPPWGYLPVAVLFALMFHFVCVLVTFNPSTDTGICSSSSGGASDFDDYDWSPSFNWHEPNFACGSCIFMAAAAVVIGGFVAYGVFGANQAVKLHVDCLYVLYAVSWIAAQGRISGPTGGRELVHRVSVPSAGLSHGTLEVSVFSDGSHEFRFVERNHSDYGHTRSYHDRSSRFGNVFSWSINTSAAEPLLPSGTV